MAALEGLLQSPSMDETILHNGKTLPDVSLGSLGSSFRSEDQDGQRRPARTPVSKAPNLPVIVSPETSLSASIATPSPHNAPASALLSLSPPPTMRKSSSSSDLPDRGPESSSSSLRRPKVIRRMSMDSATSSDAALDARYGETDDDVEGETGGILSALSINVSPKKRRSQPDLGGGGKDGRRVRHSMAPGDVSSNGPLTLRDQEQQLNAAKKDIFNLQLENHFLKERLANMAPDHIEAAIKENVKLKLEILNLSKDMKRLKKVLLQQDKDLADAQREREGGKGNKAHDAEIRELEEMYQREKERRMAVEDELEGRAGEGSVDGLKGIIDDQREEMDRLRDIADRAQDELDNLKSGLGDSIGLGKGREGRMIAKLEEENARLQDQVEVLRTDGGDVTDLEDRINELRDQLAAAQLDLDRRDQEIAQLNEELDGKVADHEKELNDVEAEWRNEVIEARAQVDELKDVLEAREEELAATIERVEELQANQAETHDRLEDTLRGIEQDNADKEADLSTANREIEALGQRIYDLEEAVEQLGDSEDNLKADLRAADEAFENSKTQYENLVAALKEARRKLQQERDGALLEARQAEEKAMAERENTRRKIDEIDALKRQLHDNDEVREKLQAELESARDRVSRRDRELNSLHGTVKSMESERQKLGDGRDSVRLQDMNRLKRGLEDDLDRVRAELEDVEEKLRQRDVDRAQMLDKQRDLESRLASERQGRLNMSDKLDMATKNARQHEREANALRERLEDIEPLLTETQQDKFQLQRQSEQQRQERSELLLRVFKEVNKFLGTEDHATPANFAVFRDTLLTRLRSINNTRSEWEKRVKDTEASVDQKMNSLKRQLDQKWRAIDNFEAAVKKLETTRMQWRSKYSAKDNELEAAKARIAELSRQGSASAGGDRANASTESNSAIRNVTERATTAERRVQSLTNQLGQLEARIADLQGKAGQAEDRWAARVKEYENRLRIAGEKIKTEKQGGKERARQLEEQVKDLEKHVEQARRRNYRAEGVVATAAHLLPDAY